MRQVKSFLILVLLSTTVVFLASAQESRVEGWKTASAQAEPSATETEAVEVSQGEGEASKAPETFSADLSELKVQISARAEALAEIERRKREIEGLEKTLTSLEKKALKQLREEQKNQQEREEEQFRAHIESNLSGCKNPEETWINPDFVAVRTWRVNAKILIRNTSGVPIDIVIGGIPAVKNLCPGGSLTLTRKLNTWQDGNSPDIFFSAQGTLEDGTIATSEKRIYLSVWQAQQELSKQEIWNICLRGSRCRN